MTSPTKEATAKPAMTTTKEQPIVNDDGELLDLALANTIDRVARTADRYATALADEGLSELRRAMILSQALDVLDKTITPDIMGRFMRLMDTDLGFKTDRAPGTGGHNKHGPYDVAIVKRCIISGLLQGVTPFFNEMNIISFRCYVTQEGYAKKCREIDGLTDLEVMPGVPIVSKEHGGQTIVRVAATWKLDGTPMQLMGPDGKPGRVFPIIVQQFSTPDNIIGKAKRKALKAVHDKITGSTHSDFDPDEVAQRATSATDEVPALGDKAASLAERLREAQPARDAQDQVTGAPTDEQREQQVPAREREPGAEG